MMTPRRSHRFRAQGGLGVVAALFVLVVLSVLGAAIARLGWTQQISSAQDMEGARAQRAANSGAEWGLFQALRGTWTNCSGATQTLTGMQANTELGMTVTVTCNRDSYVEGQTGSGDPPTFTDRTIRVYRIDAVACNSTTGCPDASRVGSIGYIERRRQVQATDQ